MIAAATAIALEAAKKRQEEEERLRAEIARRNAEAEAREAEIQRNVSLAHLAVLAAAAVAAAKKAIDQAGTDDTTTDEDWPSERRFIGMQHPQRGAAGQPAPFDLANCRQQHQASAGHIRRWAEVKAEGRRASLTGSKDRW